MISVDNLTKGFTDTILFKNVSFKINPKEKIGLVGRNGHGKTTLIKILIGDELPDQGNISCPKNYKIGFVRQHLEFTKDTVIDEAVLGLPPEEKDEIWKAEKILFGLGFTKDDLSKNPIIFSGGFQVRLNLAKVLISEPDLLLLDEPTNYLDISSIRWMENFLRSWSGELILVTHDRAFMDRVVTHVLGIHRKRIIKIKGNTEKLYQQIAKEEEIYEKTRINEEQKRKETEIFITRFRAKARLANMVQSRIKTLEKTESNRKLEKIKDLDFDFNYKTYSGKFLINVSDISFGYNPDKKIVKNFSISIGSNEKICIIGKNGKGKTTLLRLLSGSLIPQSGQVNVNKGVAKGIYEQTNIDSLNNNLTVLDEVMYSAKEIDKQIARDACGAMMFGSDNALKKISVLSGGEKSRVMLAKIIATPCNILFLDEPTNHLDMQSCDALLEAIHNFKGAVIMVTHNEMFLKSVAERLIVFQNDEICIFEGGYEDFLEKEGWSDEDEKNVVKQSENSKKTSRKKRAEIINEKSKILKPLKDMILKIENEIETLENKTNELNNQLIELSEKGDYQKSIEVHNELEKLNSKIDSLFEDLDKYSTEFDVQKQYFDRLLSNSN